MRILVKQRRLTSYCGQASNKAALRIVNAIVSEKSKI